MLKLYDKTFSSLLGTLNTVTEALVEEERNGLFELSFIMLNTDSLFKFIEKENIVVCNANDTLLNQKFRIYNIRKLMSNRVEVLARHISFDLMYDYIESLSFENQSCEYALNQLFRNSNFSQHYRGYSDIVNAQNYNMTNVNLLEAIGGTKGSIIDTFGNGSELLRDNEKIHVLSKRGHDNSVTIEYRKNLTGFELEEDTTDLVTRILPFAKYTPEGGEEVTVKSNYVDSPYINNYSHPYIKLMDYSDKFEDNEVPTIEKLVRFAELEYTVNKVDIPKQNYKITFIPLSKCVGYEGLEDKISLCDTGTIIDSRYNVNTQAKVIRYVFNVLKNRYKSMELGEPKTSLGDIISSGSDDKVTEEQVKDIVSSTPSTNYPNTLPAVPTLESFVYGFANIELRWTFENKVYYAYEVYASKIKDFTPNTFDLIYQGQASSYMFQAQPNETWYFKVCGINSYNKRTQFSNQVEVITTKISDLSNYVSNMAIGEALIGELNLGRGWIGQLNANLLDVKGNFSVTDGNGKRTFDIDSFGNINADVTSLKIQNDSVATKSELTQTSENLKATFSGNSAFNLLRDTRFINKDVRQWNYWGGAGTWYNKEDFADGYLAWGVPYDNEGGMWQDEIRIEPNTQYTLSTICSWQNNCRGVDFVIEYQMSNGVVQSQWIEVKNLWWARQSISFITPLNVEWCKAGFRYKGSVAGSTDYLCILKEPCLSKGTVNTWSPYPDEVVDGIITLDRSGISIDQGQNKCVMSSQAIDFFSSGTHYSRIEGGKFMLTDHYGNMIGEVGRTEWDNGSFYNGLTAVAGQTAGISTQLVPFGPYYANLLASSYAGVMNNNWYVEQGLNLVNSHIHGPMYFRPYDSEPHSTKHVIFDYTSGHGLAMCAANELYFGVILQDETNRAGLTVTKDLSQVNSTIVQLHGPLNAGGFPIINTSIQSSLNAQTPYTRQLKDSKSLEGNTYVNMSFTQNEIRYVNREPVSTYEEYNLNDNLSSCNSKYICYCELPVFMAENIEKDYHINISKMSFGDYRIIEKKNYYFILESEKEGFTFTYEVVAKQIERQDNNVVVANDSITIVENKDNAIEGYIPN